MRIKIGDESWPIVARPDITIDELDMLWIDPGLSIQDMMSGDLQKDPRVLRAFVWLARRHAGEFKLKYRDVDFKYSELGFELDPEDEAPKPENPTETASESVAATSST